MLSNGFRVYSNQNIINTLTSMISSGRLYHAFLLYGAKGLGKKTIAEYMAAKLLCENADYSPCGKCKSCKMILDSAHPDVNLITKETNSKAFSVDYLRQLTIDAYILPNEGDKKIYIIADCDTMPPLSQNILLKLIEEPPENTYFVFTASSNAVFIPTVLSRVLSFGVCEASEADCRKAIEDKGIKDKSRIDEAVEAFGSNIGMCLDFLQNDELAKAVALAKIITDAMISASEYQLLKCLYSLEGKRELSKTVISLLSAVLRDAAAIRLGNDELIGCYKTGSDALSKQISLRQAYQLYRQFSTTDERIDGNANSSLNIANLCAQIKKII